MTTQDAKTILSLYRPGSADTEDPDFAEALRLCERDSDLKEWFERHCGVYLSLRSKFEQITVPEGFKEQILAERRVHTTRPKPRVVRLAVVLMSFAVLVGAVLVWLRSEAPPEFAIYRQRMVGKALRSYSMDFESPDPEKVRAYLAAQKSQSDFVLPEGLQKAQLVGCVALTWQGRPAVMICFRSERPLAAGQSSDLWLFVGDDKVIPRAPANAATAVMEVNGAMTASWKRAGKVYVLVAEGDQSFIRNYL